MSIIVEKFEEVCNLNKEKKVMYYIDKNKLESKTFGQMYEDVLKMTSYLVYRGVKKQDRILAFASSNYNLCVFILAAFKIGASVMYIDIFAKQESLRNIFDKYKPDHILVCNRTNIIRNAFKEISKIKNIINIDKLNKFEYKEIKYENLEEQTPALITTTTGSTGIPKIFVRSHKDLLQQLELVMANIDSNLKDEVVLTTSYIYIFANIIQGFTTVLPNINLGSNSDSKIINKLSKFSNLDITMIITSPDFCLRTPNIYPKLRRLYFGGAILNYNEAKKIVNKYKDIDITYIYGSTECNLISKIKLNNYIEILKKQGICLLGTICNGVNIRIDKDGHILVKSDALLQKSLDEITFNDGYYDTNDIGVLENNQLIYRGKKGFLITIDGRILYSNEIEQKVILKFENISKCAMIQKENKYYLFIEDYNISKEEIEEFIKITYGIEANIIQIKVIPKDIKHHTKINYLKLEKILERK